MQALFHPLPSLRLSSLAAAVRNAVLVGAALLVAPAIAATPTAAGFERSAVVETAAGKQAAKEKPAAKPKAKAAAKKPGKPDKKASKAADKKDKAAAAKKTDKKAVAKQEEKGPGPLADFGKVSAPDEVVHVANWISFTRDNQKKAFVVIDKKKARMYVFDPRGKLKSHAPILLGKAIGDHTAPGVGNKPLSALKEEEKTTPAGKFLARPGKNNHGEDIIWIDYDAAVSMHRLRKVAEEERRFERMATEDVEDNRISNGCVNVPHKFYDGVLRPTVMKQGAIVYVLPETSTPQQLFGSYDVKDKAVQLAQGTPAKKKQ